jgi:hypothetical protein
MGDLPLAYHKDALIFSQTWLIDAVVLFFTLWV